MAVQKKIDYLGGYYSRDHILEVVENVTSTISKLCFFDATLIRNLLLIYKMDPSYTDVFISEICIHLYRVSDYILDDPINRKLFVRDGYLPEEFILDVLTLLD